MQKQVSKQSLAIVALSILLAIAMALTATFAAFTDTKTATGTITFSGNVIVAINQDDAEGALVISGESSPYTITIPEVAGQAALTATVAKLGAIEVGLAAGSDSAYLKVTIAITDTNDIVTESFASSVTDWTLSATAGIFYSDDKFDAEDTIALSSFLTGIAINQANLTASNNSFSITITVDANASAAYEDQQP